MKPRRSTVAAVALAALLAAGASFATRADAATTLSNTGFEIGGATATPPGWTEYGQAAAAFSEAGGHTGGYRLTHYAASAYRVETYQYLSGIANGSYTLWAWARSGGGATGAYIALRNCGGAENRTAVPVSDTWQLISVTTTVTSGQCTVSLASDGPGGSWANFDDVRLVRAASAGSTIAIRGADISTLKKAEDRGAVHRDAAGTRQDALRILRSSGVNYARLKVWVNPADGYNTKARVLTMAARAKADGMRLLIDFHYSDTWADPGKQFKPSAWSGYSVSQLSSAVYNHTYDVLSALKAQGTTADMVQVGNEINDGMLWPEGRSGNWANLATFLKSGISAVKAVDSSTRVMLHLAEGGNNTQHRWWFDQAVARGVPFDVIGVSHYLYWHGTAASLQANIVDLSQRYNRDVLVAETSYGFTLAQDDAEANVFTSALQRAAGYTASPQGQSDALRAVLNAVRAVPNGRGLGVVDWEPTWTAVPGNGWDPADPASGNGWENQALFDYSDRALPALAVLGSG
jgi:arabinogalactan endo-1,4-beta-galactosidase